MIIVSYQLKGEPVVEERFRCMGDAEDFASVLKRTLGGGCGKDKPLENHLHTFQRQQSLFAVVAAYLQ